MWYIVVIIILMMIVFIEAIALLRGKSERRILGVRLKNKTAECDKFAAIYELIVHWMLVDDNVDQLRTYCEQNDWNSVAIYGYGPLGHILEKKMKQAGIVIPAIIDQFALRFYSETNLITPDKIDDTLNADAIIVTAFLAFPYIKDVIEEKCSIPAVNLEEIVYMRADS